MAKAKGTPKTPGSGRKKGSTNTLTSTVKEAVLIAFQTLQKDKEANLITWGKANPGSFYTIAARLIPQEISGSVGITSIKVIRE